MPESNLLTGSRLYTGYGRLRDAAQHARLPQLVRRAGRVERSAFKYSRINAAGRLSGGWIRGSWLYRWLTSEPEPDVIVIDLRKTWTLGPVIAVLERILEPFERYSSYATIGTAAKRTGSAFRKAPVRLLGTLIMIAVVVNLGSTLATGYPGDVGLGLRLMIFAIGLLATRVDATWDHLRESAVGRALRAAFEPPEPPD